MDIEPINNRICLLCNPFSIRPLCINLIHQEEICDSCVSTSNFVVRHVGLMLPTEHKFSCMNAKAGCVKVKTFSKMKVHENLCIYRTVKCFCSWNCSPTQLRKHYEACHKDLILLDGDITTMQEGTYMFHSGGLQFIVICKQNRFGGLSMQITGLSSIENKSNATFIIKLVDFILYIDIACGKHVDLPITDTSFNICIYCKIPDVEYTEQFFEKVVCPHCLVQMTPPILRCSKRHLTCIECTGMSLNFCSSCQNQSTFTRDIELEYIVHVLWYSCRWLCVGIYNARNIREHERTCPQRIFKCWHIKYYQWRKRDGYPVELLTHHQDSFAVIVNKNQCTFLLQKTDCFKYYIFVSDCMIKVIFVPKKESIVIIISMFDVHALTFFNFEVDLLHTKKKFFEFNGTYKLNHTRTEHYCFKVPKKDFVKFENNLKVIVRVITLSKMEEQAITNKVYSRFKNHNKMLF